MSNSNYTDAPEDIERALTSAVPANDVLPSPAELVRKTEKKKITIAVDKRSLEKYRRYAKQHNAKYQSMINGVLDSYADKYLSHR
jgi:uncharacterized protein (DUF4415 family)